MSYIITSTTTRTFIFLTIFALLASCASVKSGSVEKYTIGKKRHIVKQLNELLERSESTASIGIQIVSLNTGKTIYEKNANKLFTPASSIKLMTAAAALHYLGPEFRYKTYLATDAQTHEHSVHDLYLVGSGDPAFTAQNLSTLAEAVYQRGIRTVNGDIKVDATVFDDTLYGPGWMWDDMHRYYSAPVNGVNVDGNAIHFYVEPGLKLSSKAIITQAPWSHYASIQNKVLTSTKQNNVTVTFDGNGGIAQGQTIMFSGAIAPSCLPKRFSFAVTNPSVYAGMLLKEKLQRLGIVVKGKVLVQKAPEKTVQLACSESQQLSEVLIDLTKVSNDHGFECVLKTIGAQVSQGQGSFALGIAAVNKFLINEVGISEKSFTYGDGSGLSRYSLLSAQQYIQLLQYAYNNFAMNPEFIITLPIAGADGTLAKRMRNTFITKQVRAKTGAMTGISSIAGYMQTEGNEMLAFAIMVNGASNGTTHYRNLQEKILAIVYGDAQFPSPALVRERDQG